MASTEEDSFPFSGGFVLLSFPVDDKGVFFFLLPVMSFPKSVVGNLKVFCGTSSSPSLSPREGEGKKSREVTNEKGVHKGEFFPPYTGGYFPTSFFILLSFIFCLRRRPYFMFSSFWGL